MRREAGQALLLDDGVFSLIPLEHRQEAAQLLEEAACQIICIMAHTYQTLKISGARVFGLSMEEGDRAARCRILEEGRF